MYEYIQKQNKKGNKYGGNNKKGNKYGTARDIIWRKQQVKLYGGNDPSKEGTKSGNEP